MYFLYFSQKALENINSSSLQGNRTCTQKVSFEIKTKLDHLFDFFISMEFREKIIASIFDRSKKNMLR